MDGYLDRVTLRQVAAEGALLVIDVDHFKAVNDNFGHEQGDEALRIIARKIRDEVRDTDFVGRLGGEEFSVFLPGMGQPNTEIIAERIRSAVNAAEFTPLGQQYPLSVSVGGVTFETPILVWQPLQCADLHCSSAERNSRER